jgi:hypothetical protein
LQVTDPEHSLNALLAAKDSDAVHSRYNALIRQLVSFERTVECVGIAERERLLRWSVLT